MAEKVLLESVGSLYNSERFSDVTVRCGSRTWHAHKAIICTQSEYFQKACEGEFKEAQSGCIDLNDDDPVIVEALLTYLYTADYEDRFKLTLSLTQARFHVQVFAAAEKFFINPLLHIAAAKFEDVVTTAWNEDDFASAVVEWSRTTTDAGKLLGKIITDEIAKRRVELLNPEKTFSKFRTMMNDIPWLAAEIALKFSDTLSSGAADLSIYHCPHKGYAEDFYGQDRSSPCLAVFHARMELYRRFGFTCHVCGRHNAMLGSEWEKHKGDAPVVQNV